MRHHEPGDVSLIDMLRILGNQRKLCDGLNRRDLIRAGAVSSLGLSLPHLLNSGAVSAAGGAFGRAKSVLILFLYGSPSQVDTWDMKPDQPEEIRGPFRPIRTSNPAIEISENFPLMAKWMHRVATVRTLTHPYPIHGVSFALTGMPDTDLARETNTRDPRHWPYFGSALDYVESRGREQQAGRAPRNIILPHTFRRPGPQPHWLGTAWAPVTTSWEGKSTGEDPYGQGRENPYGGISPDTRFFYTPKQGSYDLTLDRMSRRYSLLQQFDGARAALDARLESEEPRAWDRGQDLAMSLLTSPRMRDALDVQKETMAHRERYGMTLFGQSVLAGRRLIEAGSRVVTVFWDEYNLGNSAWDTHVFLTNRLKNELCPGFDRAFNALMHDLEERGLLDETLVCIMSEHGRTPRMDAGVDSFGAQGGGGRGHWSQAYVNLFAGAGIREGAVIGKTDETGGHPEERPVSPKDVLATIYHLLGVDYERTIPDAQQRPIPLVSGGSVMRDLIV